MKYNSKKYSILILLFMVIFVLTIIVFDGKNLKFFLVNTHADETAELVVQNGDVYEQDFDGDKLQYILDFDTNKATICGFRNSSSITLKKLVIPERVKINDLNVFEVTKIGEKAFSNANIFKIEVCNNIECINDEAFKGNKNIKAIMFDLDESKLSEIGEGAFADTAIKYYGEIILDENPPANFELPNKVTKIRKETFLNLNLEIKTIKFGDSIEEIETAAFTGSELIVVNFGKNIKKIGDSAFGPYKILEDGITPQYTTNLSYVYFPGDVPEFGKNVFNDSIKIYREVSNNTWDPDCDFLTSNGTFAVTESNSELQYYEIDTSDFNILEFHSEYQRENDGNDNYYLSSDYQGVVYKFNTLSLSVKNPIAEVYSLENVDREEVFIPNEVIYDTIVYKVGTPLEPKNENDKNPGTKIGTNIEKNKNSDNIKKIVLGTNIKEIADGIFSNLTGLEVLCSMADTIVLGKDIFAENIQSYEIIASMTEESISSSPYKEFIYNHNVLNKDWTDTEGMFYSIDGEYAVVGDIKDDENANTSKFKGSNAIIPDYVSIGKNFYKVIGLSRYAFYNNQFIESININAFINSYETIEKTKSESGEIVENIVTRPGISDCSLRNCPSLVLFSADSRNEKYCALNEELDICNDFGKFLAEKQLSGEKYYPNKIVKAAIDVTSFEVKNQYMTAIENYAFANCYKLTKLVIINGEKFIEKIGAHAFENTSIGFNGDNPLNFERVKELGDYAFANCYYIKSIENLNDFNDLKNFGNFVFQNCYNIERITTCDGNVRLKAVNNVLYTKHTGNNEEYYVLTLFAPKNEAFRNQDQVLINTFPVEVETTKQLDEVLVPIRRIDAYAFAYSNLTNVIIGEEVRIIGKAAFANSNKLHEITIGKKVEFIGLEILPRNLENDLITYESVLANDGPVDRNNVEIYEQEVFDNCYSLTNIKVDKANQFYMGDSNGILFNKEKTTLLYYPQGISRTTYTIPYSVTKIAIEAFENNTHLNRLIISENVTAIGSKAFNGCTKLSWIYFRSIEAPSIGEQVFNSTGSLGGGYVIYCIPQPSIWYENNKEDWSNSTVLKYNAIQEVPNDSVTADMIYTLYVVDSDGNGLSNKQITITYLNNKQKNSITDGEGYAVFTVPNPDALFDKKYVKLEIVDPDEIYSSFSENEFELDFSTTFSYVTLYGDPVVETTKYSEYYEHKDTELKTYQRVLPLNNEIIYVNKYALTYNAIYNKQYFEDNEEIYLKNSFVSKMEITTNIYLDKSYDWNANNIEVRLAQDGVFPKINMRISLNNDGSSVILYKNDNGQYVNENTDYSCEFSVDENYQESIMKKYNLIIKIENPDIFESDHRKKINFNLTYTDENKEEITKQSTLNLRVYNYKYPFDLSNLLFGDSISFNIGDTVPIIGNSEIEIDLAPDIEWEDSNKPLPIYTYYQGDRFVVAFNMEQDVLEDKANDKLDEKEKESSYNAKDKSMRNESFSTFKEVKDAVNELIKKNKEQAKLKDKVQKLESGTSHDITLNLYGVLEFGMLPYEVDGDLETRLVDGYVTGYVKYSFELQKTWVAVYIPVTLIVNIDLEGRMTFDLIAEDQFNGDSKFFDKHPLEIELKFDITVSCGVGCSLASVGIYGKLGLEMLLTIGNSTKPDQLLFNGEFGFYFRLKLGFIKISAYKALFEGTHVIYAQENQSDGSYRYRRINKYGEVESYETIQGVVNAEILEIVEDPQWVESTGDDYEKYFYEPKIVTYNNETYKFYIDDIYGRYQLNEINNIKFNKYNYLKLVYQKLEIEEDGSHTWSDPVIINDDINNELEFDVVVNETGIHIAYIRIAGIVGTENGEISVNDVCNNLEIKVITINDEITTIKTISSTEQNYMFNINIESFGESLYLSWVENTENSIFGTGKEFKEGSEELVVTTSNILLFTNLSDNTIHKIEGLGTIVDVNLFMTKENDKSILTAMYVTEQEDENGIKYESLNVTFLNESNKLETKTYKNFIIDGKDENNQDALLPISLNNIYKIVKVNSVYYIYESNSIYSITFNDDEQTIKVDTFASNLGNRFELLIVNNQIRGIIYSVNVEEYDNDDEEEREIVYSVTDLYYVLYDNGSFSNPIKITKLDNKNHIENFVFYIYDEKLFITYTYYKENIQDVKATDENGEEITIRERQVEYYNTDNIAIDKNTDVILGDVIVDYLDVRPDGEFSIFVEVRNDSLETINTVTIELLSNGLSCAISNVNVVILPGEVQIVEAKLSLSEVNKNYDVRIKTDLEEIDLSNNIKGVQLAYADLIVNTKYVTIGYVEYILVFVQNTGNLTSDAGKIYVSLGSVSPFINDANNNNEILYELKFDAITPLDYRYYTIEINRVYFTDTIISVYVKENNFSEENSEEYEYSNNINYITITPKSVDNSFAYHSIIYKINNEIVDVKSFETGDEIPKEELPTKEGYKFSGWFDLPKVMPDQDVTVYGFYEKINYTITYNVNGEPYFTDTYTFGDVIKFRDQIVKEGYSFSGWTYNGSDVLPDKMPSNNIILEATSSINTYKVLYYVDNEFYGEQEYTYSTKISKNSTLKYVNEYEGHSFSGWFDENGKEFIDGFDMPAHDIYLYGYVKPNKHTVAYYVDNDFDKSVLVEYNEKIDLSLPQKNGYKFSGWKDELGNNITGTFSMPDRDVNLYGSFTLSTYKLIYKIGDETIEFDYKYTSKIDVYEYVEDGVTVEWLNLPQYMPANDVIVYGIKTYETYKVSYIIDDVVIDDSCMFKLPLNLKEAPIKEGYTFVGWMDQNGDYISEGYIMPAHDVILTGKYLINQHTIHYFVDNNEINELKATFNYGELISSVDYNVKGYDISNWHGLPSDMIMPDRDLNIYAYTTKKSYTVKYLVDNNEVESINILYDEVIPEFIYEIEGSIVSDWHGLPSNMKMPDYDLEIKAVSNKIQYSIVYKVNGEQVKTEKLYFGDEINKFVYNYPKDYMTFTGFGEVPSVMPSHDLEFNGYTEYITYYVIYKVDGEELYRDPYIYDAEVILRQSEEKLHYDFSGWSQVPAKMPNRNIIVEGTFESHLYTLTYVVNNVVVNTVQLPYEAVIESYNVVLQAGEEFSGWENLPITMPGNDLTVYGTKQNIKYTINYYVEDIDTPYLTDYYTVVDSVKLLNSIECDGIFEGWYMNSGFSGESISELPIGTIGTINLYAKVTPKKVINEDNVGVLIISCASGLVLCSGTLFLGLKLGKRKRRFRR